MCRLAPFNRLCDIVLNGFNSTSWSTSLYPSSGTALPNVNQQSDSDAIHLRVAHCTSPPIAMVARGRAAPSSSRSGIAGRRKEHARADRDGDLVMDSTSRARTAGISKTSRVSDPNSRGPKLASKGSANLSTRARNDLQRHLSSAARLAKVAQGSSTVHSS